jgi:hypothetical protein
MNKKNTPQTTQQNPVITNSDEVNAVRPEALIQKHRQILQRLFPTKMQKAIVDSDLAQAKTELEYRERALKMLKEAQLQAIEEKYNEYLKTGKAIIRSDSGLFFANKQSAFVDEINKICDNFYQLVERQYNKLQNLNIPFLKEIEEQRIKECAMQFKESVDKLMADFVHILDEKIHR